MMTKDRRLKRRIREYQLAMGVPYCVAMRAIERLDAQPEDEEPQDEKAPREGD